MIAVVGLSLPPRVCIARVDGGPSPLTAAVVWLRSISAPSVLWRWRPNTGSGLTRLDLVDSAG
jgi:hypothetical protein